MVMQTGLEHLYRWQEENNMEFNSTKFQVLQFGSNKVSKEYNYFSPGWENPIIPSDSVKDLGVHIDNDFSYKTQVEEVCLKVKKKVGWILRTFRNRDPDFMKFIWKVYIIPSIDYCSQLWSPRGGGYYPNWKTSKETSPIE